MKCRPISNIATSDNATLESGSLSGWGRLIYSNGDVYDGQLVDGTRQGIGTFKLKNGNVYQGSFKKGKPEGFGVKTFADGSVYEGSWVQGVRQGEGLLTTASNEHVLGVWHQDIFIFNPDEDSEETKKIEQCFLNPQVCRDEIVCSLAKKGVSKLSVEKARRDLTCESSKQSHANVKNSCSDTPSVCSSNELCGKATNGVGSNKKWRTNHIYFVKYVDEAKSRGLTCGVTEINYKLKSYKTYEFTSKKGKGEITIGVVDKKKKWNGERLYSWPTGNALFIDWKDGEKYTSNSNTNQVFPALKSSFGKKSKSDRLEIQRNLKNKRLYNSTIDGLWGRNTLVALTDYSSKRLRTIRLTDPQIVATLVDQILRDSSSGNVALASSAVINEVYAHLENADKLEAKSDAFASSFKKQTKLKRQQIQYALRHLGFYKSSIDGLWGNGTKTALISFATSRNLTKAHPNYVNSHLLSLVDVPSSFSISKKSKNTPGSRSNNNAAAKAGAALLLISACAILPDPTACLAGIAGAKVPFYDDNTSSFSTSSSNTCTSDFSCGMGSKCIKKPGRSSGICMTEVNEYGTKTYSSPSSSSVGVRSYTSEACKFNNDCPIGFKCDREYKVCVK